MKRPKKATVTVPAGLGMLQELREAASPQPIPDGWMTTAQIAKHIGASVASVESMLESRKVPSRKARVKTAVGLREVNIYDMRGGAK